MLREAFAKASESDRLRIVESAVQRGQLDLIVEVAGREALSRGMQGLGIRVAKQLNKLWDRKGRVFADRYEERVLRTPREVRAACVRSERAADTRSRKNGRRAKTVDRR